MKFISFRLVEAEKTAQRVSVYTFLAEPGAGLGQAGAGLGVQNRGQAQLGSALLSFDNKWFQVSFLVLGIYHCFFMCFQRIACILVSEGSKTHASGGKCLHCIDHIYM